MNTGDLLVSVIIPTYNRSDLLSRALRSVLSQSHYRLECIVVDDASTDATRTVVEQFEDDRLVYLRHDTNRHVSAARNTGIARAKGNLVAFLDDDDEWLPTKLEKQVSLMQVSPAQVGMIYCWMDYYDDKGNVVREHHPQYRGCVFPYVLDRPRIGGCPTLLLRSAVIEAVGGFDESLPRGNDGDFIRRVCLQYQVDFVPEVLVKVHVGHGYGRISLNDSRGIRNAINGHRIKLVKFKNELHRYPRQTANIHAQIAHHYTQLGQWQVGIREYWNAMRIYPFSTLVYFRMLASIKTQLINLRRKWRIGR